MNTLVLVGAGGRPKKPMLLICNAVGSGTPVGTIGANGTVMFVDVTGVKDVNFTPVCQVCVEMFTDALATQRSEKPTATSPSASACTLTSKLRMSLMLAGTLLPTAGPAVEPPT